MLMMKKMMMKLYNSTERKHFLCTNPGWVVAFLAVAGFSRISEELPEVVNAELVVEESKNQI